MIVNVHITLSRKMMQSLPFAQLVFVCFVALRPKLTAMVMVGWSVHLTTHFPGQA